jgi:PTH1 family peptidyl-tRNA hydrolase
MYLIVGLGNPGKKFQKTRHNLGFLVLNFFAKKNKFPKFKLEKSFLALISKKKINKKEVVLMKPYTFMNQSGMAVKLFIQKNPIEYESSLLVVHDDLDIPFGKIKISFGKSSGGHKGVESIIENLNTKNFLRLRVGIGQKEGLKIQKVNFVLQNFSEKEMKELKNIIEKASLAINVLIKSGAQRAMSEFNK